MTSAGLTVANAPGAWSNGSSDAMFNTYLYAFSGGNVTVTVTNLPAGNYDFYIYGSDARYQVAVGGVDYGTKATANAAIANPIVWEENVQFVAMRNVAVAASQDATITVWPGAGGYAVISGLQLVTADGVSTNHEPVANGQSVAVVYNGSAAITLTGSDLDNDPLTYTVTTPPAHGNLTGTAPNLTYQPEANYSGPDSFAFKVNDGQVDSAMALVSINVLAPGTEPLIAVNFYAHLSGGLDATKTGLAAIGHGTNDYWNHYSRDNPRGGWLSLGALSNLKTVETLDTGAGLIVANAPGAWGNGSSDAMYNTYLYPFSGNATITITNLSPGSYDFYIYGQDSVYQVVVDGVDYGTKATTNAPISNPVAWQEDVQYVVIRTVAVAAGQDAAITVRPGTGGYAVISGLQIASAAGVNSNMPPTITSQPANASAGIGSNITFTVLASGSPPLFHQWFFNSSALADATNYTLTLTNVQTSNSGNYQVIVSNAYGSVTSAVATLTVSQLAPAITTQPQSQTVSEGDTARFTVAATGAPTLRYQWRFNGTNVYGATRTSYAITNVAPFNAGNYSVRVFNYYGAATSSVAILSVQHVNHAPVADSQFVGVAFDGSAAITLTGSDRDNDSLTYSVTTLPSHGSLTGTAPNLTYEPDANYSGPDSFTFTVNDGQVDSAPATVSINVVAPGTKPLIAVNFYAHLSPAPLNVTKTGLAATGHSASDYWNHYSRDNPQGGWLSLGAVSNLKTVEGLATGSGLTVANAPGAWSNGSDDAMYDSYLYPLGGGNVTVTVSNLATGQYDLYVYGIDSSYQVGVGSANYGTKSLPVGSVTNPTVWQAGGQYVVFPNVQVSGGTQAVVLAVSPGSGGYATISGLQLASVDATNHLPIAEAQNVVVSQDSTVPITLTGSDLDGDSLAYTVTTLPAHGALAGTAPNLTYAPTPGYAGPDSLAFKVNDGQSDSAEATITITVLPQQTAALLVAVNLYAHLSGGLDAIKTGLAAIGHTTNDFWNHYSRDNPQGGWLSLGTLRELKTVEGEATGAALTVANAPGAWGNGSSDPMYDTYLYPFGGDATVTVTNLPPGSYDFYVYGQDASYQVTGSNGADYGSKTTANAPIADPVVWQEDQQYVVFRGLQVTNVSQAVTITLRPGQAGYAVISGLQIAGTPALNPPPTSSAPPIPTDVPRAATVPATGITSTAAVLNGTVNPNGAATAAWFDWGTTRDYGFSTPPQILGSNTLNVPLSATLSGLSNSVTYFFRLTATNSLGLSQGADLSFSWTATTPVLAPAPYPPKSAFALHFAGASGQKYVVLGSTNLARWEVLGTATEEASGWFGFADMNPTNFPCRFYRLVVP